MKKLLLLTTAVALISLPVRAALADPSTAPKPSRPHHCIFVKHAQRIGLDLSADQATQIDSICQMTRTQAKAVLTADQLKVLSDAKGKGLEARLAARQQVRASLTADQKSQIREIRKAGRAQVKAILTADQIAKLKAWRQSHRHAASQPATGG
jgi:Spy/CpxP family protein refolding chaperone